MWLTHILLNTGVKADSVCEGTVGVCEYQEVRIPREASRNLCTCPAIPLTISKFHSVSDSVSVASLAILNYKVKNLLKNY